MAIDTNNSLMGLLKSNSQNLQNLANASANENSESYTPKNLTSNLALSQDRVSISYRAGKLQDISKQFFAGTINSSDIPALTKSLFEGGFISEGEYINLGGQTQSVSITSQAANFLNRYMGAGENLTNDESTQITKAIQVIENMNEDPSDEQRLDEQTALEFINQYVEKLQSENADEQTQQGFSLVQTVLTSLEKLRSGQAFNGGLNSYQAVQELET